MKRSERSEKSLLSTRLADREYQRRKRAENPGLKTKEWNEYALRNKEKVSAHQAVAYAVKTGKLEKCPCEVCRENNVYAHHDNYSEKLKVRWLCASHHQLAHQN